MRFKLILQVEKHKFGNVIPINYQYELSAVIYKILSEANSEYSEWLHNNGFNLDGKQFKLFSFSRLAIPSNKFKRMEDRLAIHSDTVKWYISFLPEKSTETFIKGVFSNRTFWLGDKKSKIQFTVKQIEILPPPTFSGDETFKALTPICISKREENGKTTYISPKDPYAQEAIYTSLINKYEAFYGKPFSGSKEFRFEVLDEPKSQLITIKADTPQETKVRGFICSFRLIADPALTAIMYDSGIGVKNSQSFGCVEVIG